LARDAHPCRGPSQALWIRVLRVGT
jgi:hypothetical protein